MDAHPWKRSRPGWTGLWGAWSGGRLHMAGSWNESLNLPTQTILWSQAGKGELRSPLLLVFPQPWGWITLNTNQLPVLSRRERRNIKYSAKHQEGGAVGGSQHCPAAQTPGVMSVHPQSSSGEQLPALGAQGENRTRAHLSVYSVQLCSQQRDNKTLPGMVYCSNIERSQYTLKITYYIPYI